MKIIYSVKLFVKFFVTVVVVVALMVGVVVFSMSHTKAIKEWTSDLYDHRYRPTVEIGRIAENLGDARLLLQHVSMSFFSEEIEENLAALEQKQKQMQEAMNAFETIALADDNQENLQKYAELKSVYTEYVNLADEVVALAKNRDFEQATIAHNEKAHPAAEKLRERVDALTEFNLDHARLTMEEIENDYAESTRTIVIAIIIAGATMSLVGLFISKIITVPLKVINNVSERIAEGDLTVKTKPDFLEYKDEIGDLSRNVEAMKEKLLQIIAGITKASAHLEDKIHATNVSLEKVNDHISNTSAATEQLSAGMEESGASAQVMNQMAAEIGDAVQAVATMASDGAEKTGAIHARTSELGNNMKSAMDKSDRVFNEIREVLQKALADSKAVNEINNLADAILEITSQTNLLALNASIEAARAGEAGRGFAVVANEIGALAQNSKDTVNQIQKITQMVMEAVNNLSSSANELLKFVAEDVNGDYQFMLKAADSYNEDAVFVSDMTSDISATSEQLAASIQAMIVTISEVSEASQEGAEVTSSVAIQTTDIATETSAILENMEQINKQMNELMKLIHYFTIE